MSTKESASPEERWLPVIGKSLAYICLSMAQEKESTKLKEVLQRVEFLEALGLSQSDAAGAAGSSAASVAELRRLAKKRKGQTNGSSKKNKRKRR